MADDEPRDAEGPAGEDRPTAGPPTGEGRGDDGAGPDQAAPLGDLADRVRSRRGEAAEEGDEAGFGLDEFFEEETFESVESDQLWDALEAEPSFEEEGVEAGEGPDEHVVPKRQYCETCEHLSLPPEVHCDHPGTTIVEFVDMDHVRVRNCPIVAARRALGEEDEGPMTQMSFGSGE